MICAVGSDPCGFSLDATLTFVLEPTTALLLGMGLAILGRRGGPTRPEAGHDRLGRVTCG